MPTLSNTPTYPVPNKQVRVAFALTESGTNYVRVWVTVAPDGSELAEKIKTITQSRFEVYEGDAGDAQPWLATFDVGGKYTFLAQEYTKGHAVGPAYEGDPRGAPTETKVGSEATLTIEIGQAARQRVGFGADTATLVLWVWDGTIRKTTDAIHGEISPRIEEPTSPIAKSAAETTAVVSAVAALVDVSCATALGTLATIVAEMVTDLNAHNALGATTHNGGADTANAIPVELGVATTPQTLIEFVNVALRLMRQHRMNDHGGDAGAGTPPGIGSDDYHTVSSVRRADLLNMPVFTGAGSQAEAYAALADIWRAHEGHRVSTVVHGTADTTNALAALPPILEVHRQFLTVLANPSPSAPPAQSTGAQLLISVGGFELG